MKDSPPFVVIFVLGFLTVFVVNFIGALLTQPLFLSLEKMTSREQWACEYIAVETLRGKQFTSDERSEAADCIARMCDRLGENR